MTEGLVFNIQHFCVDDGPGIRTTVFLKGCPLRCVWCHNAEGLVFAPQLMFAADKCVGCGRCVPACSKDCHFFSKSRHGVRFSQCDGCGECVSACPEAALALSGKRMTAESVMADVLGDRPFYQRSGGGVTLSGGEPLMQPDFSAELAELSKRNGVHVCVETCGMAKESDLLRLAANIDLFLFDFKHYSPAEHKRLTGADPSVIMSNLRALGRLGAPVVLRCPIIPDCNDSPEHYRAIAALACEMPNIREICLEPYHPFGLDKYAALGMRASYTRTEMMPATLADRAAAFIRPLSPVPVVVS